MPKQESSNVVYRSNDDEARDFTSDTTNEVMPPILCSNLPTFYVEVLYVVAKEYETVEMVQAQRQLTTGGKLHPILRQNIWSQG